jgi:hypothetical protein
MLVGYVGWLSIWLWCGPVAAVLLGAGHWCAGGKLAALGGDAAGGPLVGRWWQGCRGWLCSYRGWCAIYSLVAERSVELDSLLRGVPGVSDRISPPGVTIYYAPRRTTKPSEVGPRYVLSKCYKVYLKLNFNLHH